MKDRPFKINNWREFLDNNRANEIVEVNGVNTLDNKPLLSFSTFTQWIKKLDLYKIPENTLEQARGLGIIFMETLYDIWYNKYELKDYDFPSEQIKLMIYSFLDKLTLNHLKIIDVERHITNGSWHGYIDVVVKHKKTQNVGFVEIKTRSTNKCEKLDKIQVGVYAKITKANIGDCYVAIVNKKTFETTLYKPREILTTLNQIDKFLVAMGKENYKLNQKDVMGYEKLLASDKVQEIQEEV